MFFQTFMTWLNTQLQTYISLHVAQTASALAPAAASLSAVYVMAWGYLHLRGAIAEPLLEGVRRIVTLALVLGAALHLWLFHDVLVAVFVDGPKELAAAIVGAADPVATVDSIWQQGGVIGDTLWNRAGVLNGDVGDYLAGGAVWILVGLVCLYCVALLALAQIATAVLLALGPLFLLALLFERTRNFFEGWIAQLLNYGLIGVLLSLVAALMLQLLASAAAQTAAQGAALTTVDVLNLLLATGLVLVLMRQVLPIAAGLSRGIALSTMGVVGAAVATGLRPMRMAAAAAVAAARPPEPDPFSAATKAPESNFARPVWRRT
jgi:type IV secretion system protein VirB6